MASGWRQKQAEALRGLIYETALGLFRERGYESTSVDRITAAAGVAKGTFFNYFPSKDHVLAMWYQDVTLSILKRCRAAKFRSAEEAVVAIAGALTEEAMREPGLYAAKTRNWSPAVSSEEQSLDAALLDYLVEGIEAGKDRGELDGTLDADFFAGLILSVMTGTAKSWVVSGCAYSLKEVMVARIEFLFDGVRVRRGS